MMNLVKGLMEKLSSFLHPHIFAVAQVLRNARCARLGLGPFENNLQHMQPLSEKAKGKQRADPIQLDVFNNNNGGPIPPRQLMVRFTEGVEDLVLEVADNDSVRDAKAKVCPCLFSSLLWHPIFLIVHRQIREERPKLQRRRLRLIHAGRLLPDGTKLSSWLGTLKERQQRAATKVKVETDPSILPTVLPTGSSSISVPAAVPWLHCSVGAQLSDDEEEGEAQPQVRPFLFPLYFAKDICTSLTFAPPLLHRTFDRPYPHSSYDRP
jgi:hypothetical protein